MSYPQYAAYLQDTSDFHWWWCICLPILCIVGFFGNTLAIAVLTRPQMRCLSNVLIVFVLVVQNVILVIYPIIQTPKVGLLSKYPWPHILGQSEDIYRLQKYYHVTENILWLSHFLCVWYSFAVILEFYANFKFQEKLQDISIIKGLNALTSIFGLSCLLMLPHFFKYKRQPILYSPYGLTEYCPTGLLQGLAYHLIYRFILPSTCEIGLWCTALVLSIWSLNLHHNHKKSLLSSVHGHLTVFKRKPKVHVLVKSARSPSMVAWITITYLIWDGIFAALFITHEWTRGIISKGKCTLVPDEAYYLEAKSYIVFLFRLFQVVFPVFNFPVFCLIYKRFRNFVWRCLQVLLSKIFKQYQPPRLSNRVHRMIALGENVRVKKHIKSVSQMLKMKQRSINQGTQYDPVNETHASPTDCDCDSTLDSEWWVVSTNECDVFDDTSQISEYDEVSMPDLEGLDIPSEPTMESDERGAKGLSGIFSIRSKDMIFIVQASMLPLPDEL